MLPARASGLKLRHSTRDFDSLSWSSLELTTVIPKTGTA
jgi:hypothetical protein